METVLCFLPVFSFHLDDIFGNDDDTRAETATATATETRDENGKLLLRKEVLDVDKSSVHKGDVELGKEIISEHKSVDVPVTREEVVIIRIPVSEETVDVNKHTVVTGEISAHYPYSVYSLARNRLNLQNKGLP